MTKAKNYSVFDPYSYGKLYQLLITQGYLLSVTQGYLNMISRLGRISIFQHSFCYSCVDGKVSPVFLKRL